MQILKESTHKSLSEMKKMISNYKTYTDNTKEKKIVDNSASESKNIKPAPTNYNIYKLHNLNHNNNPFIKDDQDDFANLNNYPFQNSNNINYINSQLDDSVEEQNNHKESLDKEYHSKELDNNFYFNQFFDMSFKDCKVEFKEDGIIIILNYKIILIWTTKRILILYSPKQFYTI